MVNSEILARSSKYHSIDTKQILIIMSKSGKLNIGLIAVLLTLLFPFCMNAQYASLREKVQIVLNASVPQSTYVGKVGLNDLKVDGKKLSIDLKENYSYLPISQQSIDDLKSKIKSALSPEYKNYEIELSVEGSDISTFVPTIDREDGAKKQNFITPLAPNHKYSKGMNGDIIAMWQSHGWYFEPKLNRWEWQRARIFQTVEDLYTQSYVIPFLMPMLENAGAYVMSPRERDVNINEIIIDNDGGKAVKGYHESNGKNKWKDGKGVGFAYNRNQYENLQNPFVEGSYRIVNATNNHSKSSKSAWNAEMPEDGMYAVYVSYVTLPESAEDAVYTVNYDGGYKNFRVNQKMGGSTWNYLGHFPFKKGVQSKPIVELSNLSGNKKSVITADAVKIGGGQGNIARIVKGMSDNVKSSDKNASQKIVLPEIDYKYQISGYPRFTEAARYFMQWAGVPDSIYSPSGNINDYTDDYISRGAWVNYLAGGSKVLPKSKGLNIPVDLAFAFHTDAGTTMNDSIIGTLGIYCTNGRKKYADGTPRVVSRTLTDYIMTNIVTAIRTHYEPNWTRRGMWDKAYREALMPEVPTMLLELLSHQNFADMKYGLDPNFRFMVSREIYKGMLQFLAEREGRDYVVQPLPVNSFAITKSGDHKYLLSWKPTKDELSKNAMPTKYIVCERVDNTSFAEIATITDPQYLVSISDNKIHSYQIIALNDGGRSFPSETLALGEHKESKGDVMVVNGFTRVSAPDWFDSGEIAGFYDQRDHGVPYIQDISFIGSMFEYRRDIPWMDDDAAGFGASRANYETKVIAGNTFDYPYLHGKAIMNAGYSFVSASLQSVTDGNISINDYKVLDLILGKQKEIKIGSGKVANRFKAFPTSLQNVITNYTSQGGNIFVTGAFVATDMWDNNCADKNDIKFAEQILGYKWRVGQASVTGEAYTVPTIYKMFKEETIPFFSELNGESYAVESPDSLYPSDDNGSTFMRYKENNLIAGVVSARSNYRTCVIGFPFETIKTSSSRDALMAQILEFLTQK